MFYNKIITFIMAMHTKLAIFGPSQYKDIDINEDIATLAEYEKEAKMLKEIGIECAICCEKKLPSKFINLSCSHTACKQCLRKLYERPTIGGYINLLPKCPFCAVSISLFDMENILHISEISWYKIHIKYVFDVKLEKNDHYCLCAKCDDIFVENCSCGQDITRLSTECPKCLKYDDKNKTYCSVCEREYIRQDGCNEITCICGVITCHLCGFRIDDDYNHFLDDSFGDCINVRIRNKHKLTQFKLGMQSLEELLTKLELMKKLDLIKKLDLMKKVIIAREEKNSIQATNFVKYYQMPQQQLQRTKIQTAKLNFPKFAYQKTYYRR